MRTKILLSGFGIFGSAFLWLASFKIVAIWLGPSGVGLFSQFRQIVQVAASLGGINSIVQGVSERSEEVKRMQFRNTVIKFTFLIGAMVAFLLFFFSHIFAIIFFAHATPEIILGLKWIAFASLFSVLNIYIVGVLNGYKAFGPLAIVQVSGPLVIVVCLSILFFGKYDGTVDLLAILFFISFFAMFIIGIFFLSRLHSTTSNFLSNVLTKKEFNSFLKFALSTILAALSGTLVMLLIKASIIKYYGLERAGLFDSAWSLSFNYITLFLVACSSIYLPALTQSRKVDSQAKYITKAAYFILGSVVFISYFVMVFKIQLLRLFYSSKFDSSANVLSILLLAILIRSVSWVYGLLMVSSKKSQAILLSELSFNGASLILVWLAIHFCGTNESLAWAIFVANFLYCIFVLYYVKKIEMAIQLNFICIMLLFAILPLGFFAQYERSLMSFRLFSIPNEVCFLVYGIGISYVLFRKYMRAN